MKKATLTALKASIKHWEENAEIADLDEAKISIGDCALCGQFFYFGGCGGCPVAERTGKNRCQGTPYSRAVNAEKTNDLPAFIKAAKAEIAFLKSLLPPETAP